MSTKWESKLTDWDWSLLKSLGYYYLPSDKNPITEALKGNPNFVEEYNTDGNFNRTSLSRLATICQMVVYDAQGGPDGDDKCKALRRHWYAWYKVDFAQPFSRQLGEDEFNGTLWAGRLSQTYASLVDNENCTYRQLWVEDASRMMEKNWDTLFSGCNIVLAVEKDSLFADFSAATKAIGAKCLISGKGKNSKAATEKMLRESFGWSEDYDPFTAQTPLIVLHISDHDFDGEGVIGPTFGEQARRYTSHVLEARVGIKPDSVSRDSWQDKWYEVKVSNSGYETWAENQGLFLAHCEMCYHEWPTQGVENICPNCGNEICLLLKDGKRVANQPYGFEVEALPTRSYYGMIVDALLEVLPFDFIVSRLRDECVCVSY